MKVKFIPGKNLGTKDVASLCVTMHCSVPDSFDLLAHIDRKLNLKISYPGIKDLVLACSIPQEGNPYGYNGTHKGFVLKLDVIVPDIKIIGFLLIGDLDLSKDADQAVQ